MKRKSLTSALRSHEFLAERYWDGHTLAEPDQGVRWHIRFGRFAKSYLPALGRRDRYVFQQGQGYWVLANWLLFDLTGESRFRDIATVAIDAIVATQTPEGY